MIKNICVLRNTKYNLKSPLNTHLLSYIRLKKNHKNNSKCINNQIKNK